MTRKTLVVATSLLACALTAPTAGAQDQNANCRDLEGPSFAGWASHAQLGSKLHAAEALPRPA